MTQREEYLPLNDRMSGIHLFRSSARTQDIGALSFLIWKSSLTSTLIFESKIKPHQWEKLPWRWVVKRTLSWLNYSRRLSKDYEISVSSAETMVKISRFHTLLNRLWIQVLTLDLSAELNYIIIIGINYVRINPDPGQNKKIPIEYKE